MIGERHVIAVLTCHDNSKRLPGKVFAPFAGDTLFGHTVTKLLGIDYIDAIVVDTPHPDKCYYALGENGDKVAYNMRSLDLCGDTVPVLDVLKGCRRLELFDENDYILWVDFTKPLTPKETIEQVIEAAHFGGYDSVFTVKRLRGNLIGSAAVCSQLKPAHEREYLYWGAARLRTLKALNESVSGTWGTGRRHLDMPIINDWEIDIDYPHDMVYAIAMQKYIEDGGIV